VLADVICPICNSVYEDKIIFNVEEDKILCVQCGDVVCEIIPAISASFRLKYDNKRDMVSWGKENYSPSQYYSAQKKLCKNNIFSMPTKVKGGKKKSEK